MTNILAIEKHYSATQISALWGLDPTKVRELFQDEPGVLRIGQPSRREGRVLKRRYFSIRVPESVVLRVHARLSDPSAAKRRVR